VQPHSRDRTATTHATVNNGISVTVADIQV
jgi:hypothetical protein